MKCFIVCLMPDLMTARETAEYLRVHSATVRRWIKDGTLPAVRVGRDYRIKRADVDALIDGASA